MQDSTNNIRRRYGYTIQTVRSELENDRARLDAEILQYDRADVKALRVQHGILAADDERFWVSDDEAEDFEVDDQEGIEECDVNASIEDIWQEFINDVKMKKHKSFQEYEESRNEYVKNILTNWKWLTVPRHRQSIMSELRSTQWKMFRQGLIERLGQLTLHECDLRRKQGSRRAYLKLKAGK